MDFSRRLIFLLIYIPIRDFLSFRIRKGTGADHDQIDQSSDAEQAGCEKPENTGSGLSDVESVDAKSTEEEAQKQDGESPFFGFVPLDLNGSCNVICTSLICIINSGAAVRTIEVFVF